MRLSQVNFADFIRLHHQITFDNLIFKTAKAFIINQLYGCNIL
jgi:hypothetical protein